MLRFTLKEKYAFGAVCFVLPQVVIANSLLHHFYVHGAPLYDAGWFAYWMTHALTLDVTTIPSINDRPMLATHVFLFFFPLSWMYQIFSSFFPSRSIFQLCRARGQEWSAWRFF